MMNLWTGVSKNHPLSTGWEPCPVWQMSVAVGAKIMSNWPELNNSHHNCIVTENIYIKQCSNEDFEQEFCIQISKPFTTTCDEPKKIIFFKSYIYYFFLNGLLLCIIEKLDVHLLQFLSFKIKMNIFTSSHRVTG